MRHFRTALVVAGVAATALVGCSSDTGDPVAEEAAAAVTYHVDVDGNTPDNGLDTTVSSARYFPEELRAHPGDTVVFHLRDSGDPHTVAMGTYVDKGVPAELAALEAGKQRFAPLVPDMAAVPTLFPRGPGQANQAAAQPCYHATGAPPLQDACPEKTGEVWKGTESLVGSGWLTEEEPFTVRLGGNMSPGSYTFVCQLHGALMSGTITVVDKDTPIPSPEEVRAQARQELDEEIARLQPAQEKLATATDDAPLAGALSPETEDAYLAAFAPEHVKVPVGGTVIWTLQGVHSIEVEAPASAQSLRVEAPDGTVDRNHSVERPVGGPGFDGRPGRVDGGVYTGGFRNSGIAPSFPPRLSVFRLTFPNAGTFSILCGVHVDMEGKVTVG